MLRNWLRLFMERRISIPVGPEDLVLDVGCGDKPHWRADVSVDKFLSAEYSAQRNRGGAVEPVLPLFEADLEALPFADQAFDYAVLLARSRTRRGPETLLRRDGQGREAWLHRGSLRRDPEGVRPGDSSLVLR